MIHKNITTKGERVFMGEARAILKDIRGVYTRFKDVDEAVGEACREIARKCAYDAMFRLYRGLWESEGDNDGEGKPWANYEIVFRDGGMECRIHGNRRRGGGPLNAGFRWSIMGTPPKELDLTAEEFEAIFCFASKMLGKEAKTYWKICKHGKRK